MAIVAYSVSCSVSYARLLPCQGQTGEAGRAGGMPLQKSAKSERAAAPRCARGGPLRRMDYRKTQISRKRSWYGLKRYVKRVLSLRLPHALLRAVVRLAPGLERSGRLPAPASLREVEGRVAGTRFVMLRPDRCVVAKELYWVTAVGPGRRTTSRSSCSREWPSVLTSWSTSARTRGSSRSSARW